MGTAEHRHEGKQRVSINRVVISGNLTRDPELRATGSGMAVLQMGVAVNDRRKNPSSGEWEDVPNFFDLVMFGNRAESLSRFLSKGTKVTVEGKLRWRSWEDSNTGDKRSKVEIIVDEIEFQNRDQNSGGGGRQQQQSGGGGMFGGGGGYDDDDIPF